MHHNEETELDEKRGLWDNIHAKRARIKAGSGERMRKPGSKGAPTKQNFIDASESVQKVEGTNCKNCIFWRKDLTRPVSKDEVNENGGLKAPSDEYIKMSKEVDLVTLPGKGTVKEKAFCDNDHVMEWVTERMCCALWDGEGTKREYNGDATFMEQEETPATKARKKIEVVDRKPPHTEYTRQAEIKTKIIDEEHPNCGTPECCGQCESTVGNSQPDSKKRLMGTDSLVKAYKKDTPGQVNESLNESFNIAYAAGIGQTFTAADLGMKMQGAFAFHPSVIKQMEEMEEEDTDGNKNEKL
jgi:hypothetical protein